MRRASRCFTRLGEARRPRTSRSASRVPMPPDYGFLSPLKSIFGTAFAAWLTW